MEFGFDNIQTLLKDLNSQVQTLSAATVLTSAHASTATTSIAPIQLASFQPDKVMQLTDEVQTLKQTVASPQPASVAAQPTIAASGLADGANWPWGMAAMGGLIIGAALMYVSTNHRRKID
jgi:hypothetical protein